MDPNRPSKLLPAYYSRGVEDTVTKSEKYKKQ